MCLLIHVNVKPNGSLVSEGPGVVAYCESARATVRRSIPVKCNCERKVLAGRVTANTFPMATRLQPNLPTTFTKGIDEPLCPDVSRFAKQCAAHVLVHQLAAAMQGGDSSAASAVLIAARSIGRENDAAVMYYALDVALGFEGTAASDGRGGAPARDGERVEGYSTKRQASVMRQYVGDGKNVRTVCETGVNAGHSASGYLLANPTLHYYGFDLGKHNYTRRAVNFLQTVFPGRVTMTWGDSAQTLQRFHADHLDFVCDLAIVDGLHTHAGATR